MKKISNEDWEKIFGLKNEESERKEFEEFIKSMENFPLIPEKSADFSSLPNKIKIPKKANLSVDDTLDLHGLTVKQASDKLERFFVSAKSEKMKILLIITGKGKHSKGNPSLKPFVEKWFKNDGKFFIRNYGIAPKIHGGEGAFIVFLK